VYAYEIIYAAICRSSEEDEEKPDVNGN